MKKWAFVLAFLGLVCLTFAWWGMNTEAGQHAYDEMAGIIPLASGLLGWCLIAAAALIAFLAWRVKRSD